VRLRGVIFDLWQTLVPWPVEGAQRMYDGLAAHFGAERSRFDELWDGGRRDRELGPMEPHLRTIAQQLGSDSDVAVAVEIRRDWTREHLVPRTDAVPTLEELRRRGHLLGMISACTEEVADLWVETPFERLFDSTVFSCSVGVSKPDARIYELCAEELGLEPRDCLFVGDGANDELPGAERSGDDRRPAPRPGRAAHEGR
jgi:putative hydrolase of the HAD superfamily